MPRMQAPSARICWKPTPTARSIASRIQKRSVDAQIRQTRTMFHGRASIQVMIFFAFCNAFATSFAASA